MASHEAPTSDQFEILSEESKKSKRAASMILVVFVIMTLFIASVALILSIVGVARNGSIEFNIGGVTDSDNGTFWAEL